MRKYNKMKILLSPAKKLDFTTGNSSLNNTNISFPKESTLVMDKLSSYSALELSKLMKLRTNLSILNKERKISVSYPLMMNVLNRLCLRLKAKYIKI